MHIRFFEKGFRAYFLVLFTARRNFIPILSVYYLTLPHATASEIGFYTGAGYLASLLLNIPAGMIADRFGYKNTLVITKLFLVASSVMFLFSDTFTGFLIGSVFSALGANAFYTGTGSSFLRDTLAEMGRKSEYKKISSAIKADVSLFSVAFIIALPFLTQFDIRLPFLVGVIIDIIGLFAVFALKSPAKEGGKIESRDSKNIFVLLRELRGTAFIPLALFTSILGGCVMGDSTFRIPYLMSLGYPLVLAGMVMGLSRVVWFLVGRNISRIEAFFTPKKLLLFDIAVFSGYYLVAAFLTNPYAIAVAFTLGIGYFWGRAEVYNDLLFEHMSDPRYKATMMSVKSNLSDVFQLIITVGIGMIMGVSYRMGFATIGVILFVSLSSLYFFSLRFRLNEIVKE